ncbi:MAG: YceH family protein, partial [Thermoanaerobaculia bacterium]|nr:YceH family protein [Thermoanaerobaculia bacterium]
MQRIPRQLDAVECRVLGALLEKEQATPEYYPMTIHALVAACNQKSNREPVLELSEEEVEAALRRLFEDVMVWRSEGARALKWSHNLDRRWGLTAPTKAVMTLLLLRGAQTAGELRGRGDRLHAFATVAEVEAALGDLAAGDPALGEQPLVAELPRAPGQ